MEYNPKQFNVNNEKKCLQIAKEISFASIIYENNDRVEVGHNPVYIDPENKVVLGHLANSNPASKIINNQEVLLTFQGDHGLIKPEWYRTDNNVPTWNYIAVHLRGKIETFILITLL